MCINVCSEESTLPGRWSCWVNFDIEGSSAAARASSQLYGWCRHQGAVPAPTAAGKLSRQEALVMHASQAPSSGPADA